MLRTKTLLLYHRIGWISLFIASIIIFLPIKSRALEIVYISAKQHAYGIGPFCEMLEDPEGRWGIMDVSSDSLNGLFKLFDRTSENLGRTSSTYWLRFKLSVEENQEHLSTRDLWLLDLSGYNILKFDEVDLYIPTGKNDRSNPTRPFRVVKSGIARQKDKQSWAGIRSGVRLPDLSESPIIFYVKFKTTGTMFLVPRIYTFSYFTGMLSAKKILMGLYFGAIITMIIFNLVAYFKLKLKAHLLYVFWSLSAMLYFAGYDGLTLEYVFVSQIWLFRKILFVSVGLGVITLCLLTRSMLMTKEALPGLDKIFVGFCYLGILQVLGVFLLSAPTIFNLSSLLMSVLTGLALFAGIKRWSQGYKPAKIYLLAIFLSALGILFHALLYNSGFVPLNLFTAYSLQIGSFLEALLFTLALVSIWRASRTERQKLELQYSMLMRSSQNPVLVIDRGEKATYINPAFEKTFGWNKQDVRQAGLSLWSDLQLIPITRELARLENGNQIISMEARLNTKSGLPLDLYISTAPLLDDKKTILGSILVMQDITRLKKIEKDLVGKRNQLRALSTQLTKAEEDEQRRISMELHDGLGQQLAAIKIVLNNVLRKNPKQMPPELDDVLTTVEESISTVRALSSRLNPSSLLAFGFPTALMRLAENFSQRFGIQIICRQAGVPDSISPEAKRLLFRCVSELVFNAVKHSDCKQIHIDSKSRDSHLDISVTDDGKGFDYDEARLNTSGLGLLSIHERLQYFGGTLSITSRSGGGTCVTLAFPVTGDIKGVEDGHPNSIG